MYNRAGCKLVTEFSLRNSSVIDVHLPGTDAGNSQLAVRIQQVESAAGQLVAKLEWIGRL